MIEFLSSPALIDSQALALRLALAGVCLCALLLIAARLLRRRSEPLQYGILLGGVIGLLAVPALVGLGQYLSIPLFSPGTPGEDEILKVPMEMLPDILHRPAVDAPAIEEAATPSLAGPIVSNALWMLWALGCALGLGRLMYGFWKQNRSFIRQTWQAAFWNDELKARLAQQLGMKRFPDVDVSPAAPMPMVIGIWRPTIVLPASAPASWDQAQWEAVLLHEAAHIARGDHWAALAQHAAVLLFWWCPLVYLVSRRLNELRENICDDYALQGPCDPIAYAELLVESAERLVSLKTMPVSLALLDSAHGGLEARISRLLAKEKRTMTKLSLSGKLLGAGFLVAACILTTAATAFSGGGAQATPGKKVQIKIIIDGKEFDLNDARLLEHVEAAQKKDVVIKEEVKDAKVYAGGVQFTLPIQAPITAEAQVDPRIEELVKKAEAIKPGSGAEIRKALQAAPMWATANAPKIAFSPDGRQLHTTGDDKQVRVWDTVTAKQLQVRNAAAGKKVIILQIEDGKVQQLNEADLKKLIEKGIRIDLKLDHAFPVAPNTGAKKADEMKLFQLRNATPAAPMVPLATLPVPPKAPVPPPAAVEMQNLQRQLERITAELQDLRKRLDAEAQRRPK